MVIDDEVKQFVLNFLNKDLDKMTREELRDGMIQVTSFVVGMVYGVQITKEQIIGLIKSR